MPEINSLPVFIVDSDTDESIFVNQVWNDLELKNPLCFFKSAEEVLAHMKSHPNEPPFIIISDVSLGKMDGFQLRQSLINDTSKKYKSIPFIFWSVKSSEEQIRKAYDLSAHGFFIKENTVQEMKKTFITIIEYWFKSKAHK